MTDSKSAKSGHFLNGGFHDHEIATDITSMWDFDPAKWLPSALLAHSIATAIPFVGAILAMTVYNDMIARIRFEDPDNPMLKFVWSNIGARRRKSDLVWFYFDAHGLDTNSMSYVAGLIMIPVPCSGRRLTRS